MKCEVCGEEIVAVEECILSTGREGDIEEVYDYNHQEMEPLRLRCGCYMDGCTVPDCPYHICDAEPWGQKVVPDEKPPPKPFTKAELRAVQPIIDRIFCDTPFMDLMRKQTAAAAQKVADDNRQPPRT